MSQPAARTCSVCGYLAPTTTDHAVHATTAHPELNRIAQRNRRAAGEPSPAARPFSCWRCAALIPASQPDRRCICGWQHPGFRPDTGERDPLYQQEYPEGTARPRHHEEEPTMITKNIHALANAEAVPGNQVRWTCTCGRTGVCGPGMPSQLERLVKSAVQSHIRLAGKAS